MNVEIARTLPPARRRGGRLTPPVYDPGHKSCFDVRINPMPRGPIIPQRQETHLFAIANDAMEKAPDPLKRGRKMRRETMKIMLLAAAIAAQFAVSVRPRPMAATARRQTPSSPSFLAS